MQRPIMNPSYVEEAAPPLRRSGLRWLKALFKALRLVWRILLINPLARHARQRVVEDRSWGQLLKALFYRLAFVPLICAAVSAALVYAGTHPGVMAIERNPITVGIYYDPVSFVSADGCRLEGWLAPVIDAKKVVEQGDRVLRSKSPAVVLVHDYAQSREQMLSLVRPLHEAGFVVLATSLRGDDRSETAGVTFGLNEAKDVAAAVELLRRRPFVDPNRIGVLGIGTGAIAATLAVERDPQPLALISLRAPQSDDEIMYRHCVPSRLPWIGPLCRWTFEIAYGVNATDLNIEPTVSTETRSAPLILPNVGGLNDTRLSARIVESLFQQLDRRTASISDAGH
jgi:pimeloyl-ACP methyl ester carboxylesterase